MTPCSCALPPGVIAQEVEEVVPELVIQPNTTANPSEYKRVDYNGFIPIMLDDIIKAAQKIEPDMQELIKEVLNVI